MNHLIYKITNLINEKIYIGCHITNDIDDDYMGSGKYLKYAIEKYGLQSFKKEILFNFDNVDDMFNKEGGCGGFDFVNSNKLNIYKNHEKIAYKNLSKGNAVFVNKLKTDENFRNKIVNKARISTLKRIEDNDGKGLFYGKKHREESKKKIGKANSFHQTGVKNSQYGTIWIHSLEEKINRKIKSEDKDYWLSNGWIKGRKMKFS